MARIAILLAWAAAWLAGPALAAPLDIYGQLPTVESVALSPNGARLAAILTDGEQRKIAIQEVAAGKTVALIDAGSVKVRDLQWAGDGHVLISMTTTARIADVIAPRDEYMTVVDYDVAANKTRPIFDGYESADSLNIVLRAPSVRIVEGRPMVFITGVHFVEGRSRVSLFRADLERRKMFLDEVGGPDTRLWLVGADGQPVAQSEYDARAYRWTLKLRAGRGWRAVKTVTGEETPDLLGFGRDGKSLLIGEAVNDKLALREVPVDTGEWREPFATEGEVGFLRDPASYRLIGFTALEGDEASYRFFEPADQRAWAAVVKAYAGQRVQLIDWSDDRKLLIVRVDSPTEGPAYAKVDLKTGKAEWIAPERRGITDKDVAPVRPVKFKAADGLELSGYLTLPLGREAKGLPLVVFPHGGPAARDMPGFDWWAQAMASRGYAVLQVNFRGSEGFGRDFLEKGFGQWGRKMQTDLSDGVRSLASQGTIDPKRVCIVGASYGGYAAMAGAAFDSAVYRCAASVGGVTELRKFVTWSKTQNGLESQRYWTRFMGADDPKDPVLQEISPALNAGKVAAPVLLIHGRDDTVVPFEQSRVMAEALKEAGKPVELVTLPSEDHWLSRGATRQQMLAAVVAFLEKHNPPN
jgi:dipeptidyl aminopeptidase/acylaminoacyl peptidase